MKLNRSQLAQVFTNHETLRAFEQVLKSVDDTLPGLIAEALAAAVQAIITAELTPNAITLRSDIEELRGLIEQAAPSLLQSHVDESRCLVEQIAPAVILQSQIDQIRAELAMIEDAAALIRYILTRYATAISPALTGTPTAPTAAVDTNTTQIATCAFVLGQAASATPLIDGTAAVGTSTRYARGDHVHPTDTTRAPIASPTFTGTVTSPRTICGTSGSSGQYAVTLEPDTSGQTVFSFKNTSNALTVVSGSNPYSGGTELARLDSNGNLGIGTTVPAVKLHLKASSNAPVLRMVQDNTDDYGYSLQVDSSDGHLKLKRFNAGSDTSVPVTLTSPGNLLIGTTTDGMTSGGSLAIAQDLAHRGTKTGFYNTTPVTKPTVTGSRGGNAALASLLTALASTGLITDSTTA
jgi:hypothetical protein